MDATPVVGRRRDRCEKGEEACESGECERQAGLGVDNHPGGIEGSTVTLTITEGAGAPDTAVGAFTVAFAGCIEADAFGPSAPSDAAGPVNKTVSFNSSTLSVSGPTLRLTLSSACVGCAGAGAGQGSFTPVPAWWPGDTSVHASPIRNVVARPDARTTTEGFDNWTGCTIIIPLCVAGRGNGSGADLYCVRFGAFRAYQPHQTPMKPSSSARPWSGTVRVLAGPSPTKPGSSSSASDRAAAAGFTTIEGAIGRTCDLFMADHPAAWDGQQNRGQRLVEVVGSVTGGQMHQTDAAASALDERAASQAETNVKPPLLRWLR